MGPDTWNRCDVCGQFISFEEFISLAAIHRILEPDSELGVEKWETYHVRCNEKPASSV